MPAARYYVFRKNDSRWIEIAAEDYVDLMRLGLNFNAEQILARTEGSDERFYILHAPVPGQWIAHGKDLYEKHLQNPGVYEFGFLHVEVGQPISFP